MNPNDVVGTPREYDVWLAPDWSDWDESTKKGSNWTRVKVRETLYANGRKATEVLNEGQPVSSIQETIDKDQEKRFKDGQTSSQRQTDQAERRVTRKYPGTDPTTGRPAIVTEYESGPPSYDSSSTTATGDAKPPETKDEGGRRFQWTPNPGGPTAGGKWTDVGPAPLTAAERAAEESTKPGSTRKPVAGKPGVYEVTTTNPTTKQTETHFEDEAGARVPTPTETPKETRESIRGKDGNPYTKVTKTDPTTGKAETFYEDAKGARVSPPGETTFAIEPPGAPPASTQYGSIMEGLPKYRDFLNQQVAAGNLTPDAADKLMQTRLAQAKATHEEQQGVVSTQTGIHGQEITQRGQTINDTTSRRTAAGANFQGVLGQFMPLLKYLPATAATPFVDSMLGLIGEGQRQAEAWGGMKETPPVQMGPAAAMANRAQMPGQGGPSFMTPYAPQGASAAMAARHGAEVAAPVVAAPAPVVAPVVDPAMAAAQAAQQAASQPGIAPNVVIPQQGTTPPVNPMPGQPGSDPNAPIGMAPAQGTFLQPYQQPQIPAGSGLELMLQDPDMPNDVVAQAYAEIYGQPMPGWPPVQQAA